MKKLHLALGSNIGDRQQNILDAYRLIEEKVGSILLKSDFYENEAEGFIADTLFLNTCIEVNTNLAPLEILDQIKDIEQLLGKKADSQIHGYVSRPIDIDIILMEDVIFENERLSIPHKLFRKRTFVLFPLKNIAGSAIDPKTQLSVSQLFEFLQI